MQATIKFIPTYKTSLARTLPPVAVTEDVERMLAADAVCAIGVSGGKDSQACTVAVIDYLNEIGHRGPRILVHADLGRVEWNDSLPVCEELAAHYGLELMVVRRPSGDMMDRWQSRWRANLQRYTDLSCVKLILPWSTPSMRFCTSELKVDVITRALKARYPEHDIVNVAGIRRQESATRSKMPIAAPQKKLERIRKKRTGLTWNAIIEWKIEDVFASIDQAGLRLHEAYTRYQVSRVSCAFCIMSCQADLSASATCEDNADVYREMVMLEAESTYAFQGQHWLADTAPHLLPTELLQAVVEGKAKAARRVEIESRIPERLLYMKGWPTAVPSDEDAKLLASVRIEMAQVLGIQVNYTTPESIQQRYAELLAIAALKKAKKGPLVDCIDNEPIHDEEQLFALE
jgi:3'-phosphoadenosine 5'-phosphosulfate sulfotransferase (PAPS reductase)/FAD synthetase